MKRLLFITVMLFAANIKAETIESNKDSSCMGTCGAKITSKAGNVPAWTGWIYTGKARAVIFDVTFVDNGAGDGSAITMRCESSNLSSTANDAGFDLHGAIVSCVSPACTTSTYANTWTTPTPGAATTIRWNWTVDSVPNVFLNCYFAITSGAAAESYSVSARGVSP